MTIDALKNGIQRLIEARRQAHGDDNEQKRINDKLTKLYNLLYLAIEQEQAKQTF